ncbi:MAG: DUF72 domain-containing protein [Flavobacterium circumlabens]|uniref:DUF72 domain-containing protein n=1 Tax=Flavobacterium circumlabens TaxID=2133765 RepID=A0A4Y7UF30_9FLAO|nr:DUF72 domain-containing protein [Flavobacterium circumlabens]TCN59816.1 uncharacterized protein YecE (DUF72 family) [Flavobacterium circumlabens]TEB45073.1 DUF72 domain-containing protein [Flavobacterium circumlabens]
MKKELLTGCSSYNNRYWKGIFYPENLPTSKWFDYYCQHFDTYEMNGTFYKFPTLRIFENWYKKVPENFLFAVKAPKEITHIRKFTACETLLSDFYSICENGLREKLGPILFQFPPSYDFTEERLQTIIKSLDTKFMNVIEFRHKSWWNQHVRDTFIENKITFCSVSYPGLPDVVLTEFPMVYVRLHGDKKLFYSGYSTEKLEEIKKEISKSSKSAFVYFNNTAGVEGISNALEFKAL